MNFRDKEEWEWEAMLWVLFTYLAIIEAIVLFWIAIAHPDWLERIRAWF